MLDKVEAYLASKKSAAATPELAEILQNIENLYSKKLWHQLTLELRRQVNNAAFAAAFNLHEFFTNVIVPLESRVNLLHYAEIAMPVARQLYQQTGDKAQAVQFLEKVQTAVQKDKQARIRAATGIIEILLDKPVADIAEIRSRVEAAQVLVDDLTGVTAVHAAFYKQSANYLKEVGNHAAYYREALRYLGCEDIKNLTQEQQHQQALLLGFSALLGEDIYNFGELLAHPVLHALDGTPEHWLVDVLYSFNSGDLLKFREYEPKWNHWSDMVNNREPLEGKIRLLCIMEIALGRNTKDRHITFNEISQKALVDVNQVEFLVMKALAKGLVKGSIDQVNRSVNITWVQPRVLSPAQIYQVSERIGAWRADVAAIESVVRDNAKEILMKT